jgi:hypothetical protein
MTEIKTTITSDAPVTATMKTETPVKVTVTSDSPVTAVLKTETPIKAQISTADPIVARIVTGEAGSSGTSGTSAAGGIADFASSAGTSLYAGTSGTALYAASAGNAGSAGSATTAANAGTAEYAISAGNAGSSGSATTSANAGSSSFATTAAISGTAPYSGTASFATSAGESGSAGSATTAANAGSASFATTAGIAGTAPYSGTSEYSILSGTASFSNSAGNSGSAGSATTSANAGSSSFATTSSIAGTAPYSGTSSFATSAGDSGSAGSATTAANAGSSSYTTTASIAGTSPYSGTASYATTAANAGTAYKATSAAQAGSAGSATTAANSGSASFATTAGISGTSPYAGTSSFATSASTAGYAATVGPDILVNHIGEQDTAHGVVIDNDLHGGVVGDGIDVDIHATLGAELSPVFTAANWTAGAGWSINDGTGIVTAVAGVASDLTPSTPITANITKRYKRTFVITDWTAGTLTATFGGVVSTPLSGDQTVSIYIDPYTTGTLTLTKDAAFAGKISLCSLKEITKGNLTIEGDIHHLDSRGHPNRLAYSTRHMNEMQTDTLLDKSRSTLSCTGGVLTYTLIAIFGNGTFNFNGIPYPVEADSVSIALTAGTDAAPQINYVNFHLVGNTPTLRVSTTYPTDVHIDVATWLVGTVSGSSYTIYAYDRNRYETESLVKRIIERFEKSGTLYSSGGVPTVAQTTLSIASGCEFFNGIFEMTSANTTTLAGFTIIKNGAFSAATSIAETLFYSDGTAVGNHYFANVVWGIVPTTTTAGGTVAVTVKLYAILQTKPTAEYTLAQARQDLYEATNYYPSNSAVKNVFVPICRTIVSEDNPTQFQTFDTGLYHKDVRGKITSGGGAATSYTHPNHTGEVTSVGDGALTIGTLTHDLQFATYKAIAMACDNGATLPSTPVIGQWFLHTPTGRNVLMQYTGSAWQPIISFGSMTMYVAGNSVGSDVADNGTGTAYTSGSLVSGRSYHISTFVAGDDFSNVGAYNITDNQFKATGTTPTDWTHGSTLVDMDSTSFLTGTYAVSIIPPVVTGTVYIRFSGDTFAETIVMRGKYFSGNYRIQLYGTLEVQEIISSATITRGTGIQRSVITKSGAFNGDNYANVVAYYATDGIYRIIDGHTVTLPADQASVPSTDDIAVGDIIKGATSGAYGDVLEVTGTGSFASSNWSGTFLIQVTYGTFQSGENLDNVTDSKLAVCTTTSTVTVNDDNITMVGTASSSTTQDVVIFDWLTDISIIQSVTTQQAIDVFNCYCSDGVNLNSWGRAQLYRCKLYKSTGAIIPLSVSQFSVGNLNQCYIDGSSASSCVLVTNSLVQVSQSKIIGNSTASSRYGIQVYDIGTIAFTLGQSIIDGLTLYTGGKGIYLQSNSTLRHNLTAAQGYTRIRNLVTGIGADTGAQAIATSVVYSNNTTPTDAVSASYGYIG